MMVSYFCGSVFDLALTPNQSRQRERRRMQTLGADRQAAAKLDDLEAELQADISALTSRLNALERRAQELKNADLTPVALEGALEDLELDVQDCRRDIYRLVAHAMNWAHSPFDVEAWCRRAVEMDASHPGFGRRLVSDLVRVRKVPNAPIRQRLLALLDGTEQKDETMSQLVLLAHRHLAEVERETGQDHGARHLVQGDIPQVRHLRRLLGMEPRWNGRLNSLALFITYEQAVAFARAFDMSPQEAGV